MAENTDTLQVLLLEELNRLVAPVEGLRSVSAALALVRSLGWEPPANALAALSGSFLVAAEAASVLRETLQAMKKSGDYSDLISAGMQLRGVFQAALQVKDGFTAGVDFFQHSGIADDGAFFSRLLDFLVVRYLRAYLPRLHAALVLGGLIGQVVPPNPPPRYQARDGYAVIYWSELGVIFSKPEAHLAKIYGWGADDLSDPTHPRGGLNEAVLFRNLVAFLGAWGVAAGIYPREGGGRELRYPFYRDLTTTGIYQEIGAALYALSAGPPSHHRGLALAPYYLAAIKTTFTAGGRWEISLEGRMADAGQNLRLEVRPGESPVLADSLTGGQGELRIRAAQKSGTAYDWYLLGAPGGTYTLVLRHAEAGLALRYGHGDDWAEVRLQMNELALTLTADAVDGFLKKIFPTDGIEVTLGAAVAWTPRGGLHFEGSAGMEIVLPINKTIFDTLTIESIYLAFLAEQRRIKAVVAASANARLGPLAATVDRVGLQLELTPRSETDPPGNLGNLNLGFGFKPPNGLGLLIDAGAVVGGGYIFFDADKGEYAGVLELKLEAVQVKIIGLLDTKLPDGKPGFSFLLIVSVEFTPIQLGFGFSLNGVGGLAGINRTMLLDVLRAGLRNHTLNSILFPQDPVRHAAQLISDLRSVFPPVEGRYLFGPMLEIAWGGFILIAKLGVVLELPAPVRLAILGQITAAMPTPDEALIIIHMDVLGAIDFEQKKLSIDATLYDSRIEIYSLLGDMALRLTWGDNPNFALSLGGFFPGFQPPPGFPALRRLMLSVSDGDIVQLSQSIYLAFTTNSVQFGANLELKVDHDDVSIHGHLGYDAFFIFSPFSFIAHMQGDVELKTGGTSMMSIRLDATLTGPTHWHLQGSASIDMLFFSISVHVDVKFGDDRQVTLPQIKVLPQLLDALKNPQNWHGSLPGGAETAVSLAKVGVDEKTILMQPMCLLTVRQTVVPLGVQIAKFNNAAPADADSFDIDIAGVTIGGKSETGAEVPDYFASGQFFALGAAAKVSAPSYTRMKAGVKVGSEDLQHGNASTLELHYETFIVDDLAIPGKKDKPYGMTLATMLAANRIGAAELSLVRGTGNARYVVPGTVSAVSTSDPAYVVASTTDLSVQAGLSTAGGAPYFAATAELAANLAAHPEDAGMFQVLPLHEAKAVTT